MAATVAEDPKFPAMTLTKKKDKKEDRDEVQVLEEEGKEAIKIRDRPEDEDLTLELKTGERKTMVRPHALEAPEVLKLMDVLMDWINEVLADRRIIVRDIRGDLFDGQVLSELLEELGGVKIEHQPYVGLSTQMQRLKLKAVLSEVSKILKIENPKWSVDSVHGRDPIAILHLLVALARHFHCPTPLPHHVHLTVIEVASDKNKIIHRNIVEELTGEEVIPDEDGEWPSTEPDVFDTLFESAPEKINTVMASLTNFSNRHLGPLDLAVEDLEYDYHDGVRFISLMSVLEGYFVPFCHYHRAPKNDKEKMENVQYAMKLMKEAGLKKTKARTREVVEQDIKATLRVLYNIFHAYKNV